MHREEDHNKTAVVLPSAAVTSSPLQQLQQQPILILTILILTILTGSVFSHAASGQQTTVTRHVISGETTTNKQTNMGNVQVRKPDQHPRFNSKLRLRRYFHPHALFLAGKSLYRSSRTVVNLESRRIS